jgi:hypothetical protein
MGRDIVNSSLLYRSAPVASAACAVHCLAAPLLVSVAPALATAEVEWGLLLLGAAVSGVVLRSGFRAHGRIVPVLAAALCVALWVAALGGLVGGDLAEPLTFVASIGLAAATYWSGRLRHAATCESCACPAHRADTA